MNHDPTIKDKIADSPEGLGSNSPKALKLDPEKYRDYLDEFELSEEQQNELLETLWHIMRTFVEIGWGLDSVQSVFSGIAEKAMHEDSGALQEKDHFNQLAETNGQSNTERSRR
ncbi:MAG: hypothetical protein AB2799_21175 [Candidatus Thiodiazotropha sp.]